MRPDRKTRVFTLIVILTQVLGNFALSWGLKHEVEGLSPSPLTFLHAIFTPYVLLGISLLIVWLLTRMTLLSWADLSFVVPMTSIGYVMSAVLGVLFLSEVVTPVHWLGTLLIFAGTLLVGSTQPRSGICK